MIRYLIETQRDRKVPSGKLRWDDKALAIRSNRFSPEFWRKKYRDFALLRFTGEPAGHRRRGVPVRLQIRFMNLS